MHFAAFLVFLTVTLVESSPFNCTNCGNVKCGENEVFVTGKARRDEFCKPFYTPITMLEQPRQCVCKPHFVRNSWGECVPKKNCFRCKSRLQKDWHLCSSSCPVTGNKAIRFFCRTMCTPGCDCPPGWVVDPNNWKKCIKAEAGPPLCQPHSRFQPCVSTCEPVCGLRPPKHCFTHCHRGACVCNKGFAAFVRNSELICVRKEKCEWYLRTAQFFALNRTAGRENLANNLGSVTSGSHGVVLPGTIGHAISSERTYSVGSAPNDNTVIGLDGVAIRTATPSSGNAIGLGSTNAGIGAAGVLSSGAAGSGGIGAGLGSTLTSISTMPGMSGIPPLGASSVVSLEPGLGDGRERVESALSSVSMGSTANQGDFPTTSVGTGVYTEAGAVGTSTGAAPTTGLLLPVPPGLSTVGAPLTNVPVTDSGTAGIIGPAGLHPNVHVHEAIAVNSSSATTPNPLPSVRAAGLGEITPGITRGSGSVPTRPHFNNTGAAGAPTGVFVGSVVHGVTSTTGGAVGLLSDAGARRGAITMTTGAAVPVSGSHGGMGVATRSAPTAMSSAPRSSGTILSGTSALPSLSGGGIHADGERASGRSSVVIGRDIGNEGPRAAAATSLLTSTRTENDQIVARIAAAHGSASSDSYRLASLSTLPDGIYSIAHGRAMIPSFPVRSPGVPIGASSAVSPPHVRATSSEIGTGLSARSRLYIGRSGETVRITVGNGNAEGFHPQAFGRISAGVNGENVLTAISRSPVSSYRTGSRGPSGAVSTSETPTVSIYPSGSSSRITTESGSARADGPNDLVSVLREHGAVAVGGVATPSTDASSGVLGEAGGIYGFNGADGRHRSVSLGHRGTYTNTIGNGLNINGELVTSTAGNKPPVSTSSSTNINGTGRFVPPPGASNSHGTMPIVGTQGTAMTRTTYTSQTPAISGTGADIEAANNVLVGTFTYPGNIAGTSHAGAVSPYTTATTRQNLGTHVFNVIPVRTVGTIPTVIGGRTESAGVAAATENARGRRHQMHITNPYSVTFDKTLSDVYPSVLPSVLRSAAVESASGSLISGNSLRSSLPHESIHSPNIDVGENLPNTATNIESANTPV
uniref:TIL domain containing protein n=1 Tax=Rhipicephalus zambeziensis TaxID=60191 RepID=A0A224YFL9_9ACAR